MFQIHTINGFLLKYLFPDFHIRMIIIVLKIRINHIPYGGGGGEIVPQKSDFEVRFQNTFS